MPSSASKGIKTSGLSCPYDYNPDPTRGISALADAAVHRLEESMALQIKRIEDILYLQIQRLDEELKSHIKHAGQMSEAECERVNAVREMDVKTYNTALEQAAEHRLTLSNRIATTNDGMRALISATQDVLTKQGEQRADQLGDRITLLEKTQYQTQGKDQVSKSVLAFISAVTGAILAIIFQRFFMGK